MKPRRIFSALLLSLGLILLTFAATCRLVMTNIQIDYDPSSPATVTLTVFGQSDEYALAIDAGCRGYPLPAPCRPTLHHSPRYQAHPHPQHLR